MREYELYLIKEAVAHFFDGKERCIFNLFKEFKEASGELKQILQKQIDYITEPIPALRIHTQLVPHLQKNSVVENGTYVMYTRNGQARLWIEEKRMMMVSSGAFEAEMMMMEALRKIEYNFFASDTLHVRFGWLKPLKERKLI